MDPPFTFGPEVEFRGTHKLRAYVCGISSRADALEVVEQASKVHRIRQRRSLIWAYNLVQDSQLVNECVDGGVFGAGDRLCHFLRLHQFTNVVVVVAYWKLSQSLAASHLPPTRVIALLVKAARLAFNAIPPAQPRTVSDTDDNSGSFFVTAGGQPGSAHASSEQPIVPPLALTNVPLAQQKAATTRTHDRRSHRKADRKRISQTARFSVRPSTATQSAGFLEMDAFTPRPSTLRSARFFNRTKGPLPQQQYREAAAHRQAQKPRPPVRRRKKSLIQATEDYSGQCLRILRDVSERHIDSVRHQTEFLVRLTFGCVYVLLRPADAPWHVVDTFLSRTHTSPYLSLDIFRRDTAMSAFLTHQERGLPGQRRASSGASLRRHRALGHTGDSDSRAPGSSRPTVTDADEEVGNWDALDSELGGGGTQSPPQQRKSRSQSSSRAGMGQVLGWDDEVSQNAAGTSASFLRQLLFYDVFTVTNAQRRKVKKILSDSQLTVRQLKRVSPICEKLLQWVVLTISHDTSPQGVQYHSKYFVDKKKSSSGTQQHTSRSRKHAGVNTGSSKGGGDSTTAEPETLTWRVEPSFSFTSALRVAQAATGHFKDFTLLQEKRRKQLKQDARDVVALPRNMERPVGGTGLDTVAKPLGKAGHTYRSSKPTRKTQTVHIPSARAQAATLLSGCGMPDQPDPMLANVVTSQPDQRPPPKWFLK